MSALLLKALRCEEVARPPVWLMRQAGRYMPQYQEIRRQCSLWQMFHDPEVAARVTLLPIELLGVDAAILFSDILVVAESLGLRIEFVDGAGPRVVPAVRTRAQVDALPVLPAGEVLGYVFETIRQVKGRLEVPLIGFCGGPFTVASYVVDSTSKEAFVHTKEWMRTDPQGFEALLEKLTEASVDYLRHQVEAGADVIQIFDSWANVLDDAQFARFCLPYLRRLVASVTVPVIVFCRSSSLRHEALAGLGATGISFDWHVSMAELRKRVPAHMAIQGNFDPAFLKQPIPVIQDGVRACLAELGGARGVIVNLGHGVTPDIPLEHVRAFVDAVKEGRGWS